MVFADGEEVPEETLEVLERHPEAPVYVLGPEARAIRKGPDQPMDGQVPSDEQLGTDVDCNQTPDEPVCQIKKAVDEHEPKPDSP